MAGNKLFLSVFVAIQFVVIFVFCSFFIDVFYKNDKAGGQKVNYVDNESLASSLNQPSTKELQWNRYVTDNFELLSLDDAQGSYLYNNIEFIKTWISWRWGMKDFDFPTVQSSKKGSVKVKCRVICVPSVDLFDKLFGKKTSSWRVEIKDEIPEYTIWFIADNQNWNTRFSTLLTDVILANFEANTGTKFPLWCHKGMGILNGRIEDIRSKLPLANSFDSKTLLTMTSESYEKLSDQQKASYDAQAAFFCLWARQEFNGKIFLDYLGGSMINPEYCLQYFGVKSYVDCDCKVRSYVFKLSNGSDYYFNW